MRRAFACIAALLLTVLASHASARVIILGFDGVEPSIVEQMLAANELPNLARIKTAGTYARLATTNPPQSPTAWASFATCQPPDRHGIRDFLRRTPSTYRPDMGFGGLIPAALNADGSVASPPKLFNLRKGAAFWKEADRQGLRVRVINAPFDAPAEPLEHGCEWMGLGIPDLRGTQSTFFALSDRFTPADLAEDVAGGKRIALRFDDANRATISLPGIRDPRVKDTAAPGAFTQTPVTFTVDRAAHKVEIALPGRSLSVAQGTWSDWAEWEFVVSPQYTARAISRFYVVEAGTAISVYMTCLMADPRAASIPLSVPPSYASSLAARFGLFKTVGWSSDTHAVRAGALPEDAFLDDDERTSAFIERVTLDELERGDFDLLIAVWTDPDRIAHMFWRFRDPKHPRFTPDGAQRYGRAIEDAYRRMDNIAGKVAAKLKPDDLLIVMSDHGFKSFRRGFNINTWLVRNGYLAVQGQADAASAENRRDFLEGYDWTRSRAYSLGLNSVYINLRGREGQGSVASEEAAALTNELRERLLAVRDPSTNAPVFDDVTTTMTPGSDGPDLVLGYADGYQSTKEAAKGAAPAALFEDNASAWSGDHAGSSGAHTPGILFVNAPVKDAPSIMDIGVTALTRLGARPAADVAGKNFLK